MSKANRCIYCTYFSGLNFSQEKFEADFRYSLVRVRENSESIAFYSGEPVENGILVKRFFALVDNYSKLLLAERNLQFFTSGYRYVIQVYNDNTCS